MSSKTAKKRVEELLSIAGVSINGSAPWDIQVHNENFYERVLAGGSLALGESYMDKWWDCKRVDQFISNVLNTDLENIIKKSTKLKAEIILSKILNYQTPSRARANIHMHYDMGNELFRATLDKRMVYSCAYWQGAATLDEAQENKLHLACRKLKLQPGMHVLDIGSGWGSFARFAAEKYDVRVTGIAISEEQVKYARQVCEGLPVEIKFMDYRELNQKFDRIASFGMFEHVGQKNHHTYMEVASRCMDVDGLFLLETIGNPVTRTYPDRWMDKYIFPNAVMPSMKQMGEAIEGVFLVEDLHNFAADEYVKMMLAWNDNFVSNWNDLKDKYDERFYRMWTYYLLFCTGGFRARRNVLWQFVLSKRSRLGEYVSER
jgi:cyclopropane-fatty-acyl-phospholipid synthase